LLLATLVASCTSHGARVPSSPSPGRTGAGGTLRVGLVSDHDSISGWCPLLLCGRTYDPQSTSFIDVFELDRCCFMRTLLSYDGTSVGEGGTVLRPDLATALPTISPDGLTWTFRIRSGVHYAPPFQHTEITAGDFIRSLERAFTPAGPAIPWANGGTIGGYYTDAYLANVITGVGAFTDGTADHVSGLQSPDPHTLVIHLTKPVGDLGYRLALPGLGPIPANPARPGDPLGVAQGHDFDYGDVIVSSGPYMFQGSERLSYAAPAEDQALPAGDGIRSATLVRNPSWSPGVDPVRQAFPDRIEFSRVDTANRAERLVRSGALDVVLNWSADPEVAARWMNDASVLNRVAVTPGDGERYLSLNLAMPPLDDVHVRRAINLAVDRRSIAAALQSGGEAGQEEFTHLALDSDEDNLLVSYAPPGVTPTSDLAAAQQEMRKSRYDTNHDGRCDAPVCSGIRLIDRRSDPALTHVAHLIASELGPLGLDIRVDEIGDDAANSSYGDPFRHIPLRITEWFKDFPSASTFFPPLLSSEALGKTNNAITGATEAQLRHFGYTVGSVPNLDGRMSACEELVFQGQTRCWAQLDQYLSEQVVPWVPLTQQVEGWIYSTRVRGFTVDASIGIPLPALDHLRVVGPEPPPPSTLPTGAVPPIPDGTYRTTVTAEDIVRFGGPKDDTEDAGTFTVVLRNGGFLWHQRSDQPVFNPIAVGSYTGSGDHVRFTVEAPADNAVQLSDLAWHADGGAISFSLERCTGPAASDAGFCGVQKAMFTAHPWERVGGAGS
jgi:peptide/nickel transport system substrate-binding protein